MKNNRKRDAESMKNKRKMEYGDYEKQQKKERQRV